MVAAATFTGACDPGEPAGSSSPTPRTSQSSTGVTQDAQDAKDAKAILDQAFAGREELGSGSGTLRPQLGNTLPAPDKSVLSVTFAFACTGNGKVAFTFAVGGRKASSAADTGTCDRSIFQRSVEIHGPRPGPVTFEAGLTGSDHGGFAYSYYTEKKQLP